MLSVNNLDVFYGKIQALRKVNVNIEQGETVAIIGANGAGKTTLLKTIVGLVKAKNGTVVYDNTEISSLPPWEIAKRNITLVPEGRQVFPEMTVFENLLMGAYLRKNKKEINEDIEKVYQRFPKLKIRSHQLAGTLSGGEQQMLAMGRALMSQPKLLLLDEPSMGLAPIIVEEIYEAIKELICSGATILLIEQNAMMALNVANRAYVLENGKIVLEDKASELLNNVHVKEAYLGI